MNIIKYIFSVLFFLTMGMEGYAQYVSIGSGAWNDPAIWQLPWVSAPVPPSGGQTVIISSGNTITGTPNNAYFLNIQGTLIFEGNYTNNGGGLIVADGGTLIINGNLNSSSSITLNGTGKLLVSGDLNETGGSITINSTGILVVGGNFNEGWQTVNIYNSATILVMNDYNVNGNLHDYGGTNTDVYVLGDVTGGGCPGCLNTIPPDDPAIIFYCQNSPPARPGSITQPAIICANSSGTFSITPVCGATSYTWSTTGTGWAVTSGGNTTSATITMGAGKGTVSVTATNSHGTSPASSTGNINPTNSPAAPTAGNDGPVCIGGTLSLIASNVPGSTYSWTGPNGFTSSSQNPTVSTNSTLYMSGTYSVIAIKQGCSSTVGTTIVTVNPNNPVSVSIAANTGTTICAGTSVTFTATPTNGGTTPAYQWKLNGTNVGSNSPTYTTTTLVNGNVVTCELTSNVSCPTGNPATSNSLTMTVNPNNPVSVSIAANTGTTICAGTSVTFTATPTNGGTTPAYQWKLNGTNVGSNSPTYTTTTLVNGNVVTCELTSNVSCPTGNPATSNSLTMTVNPNNPVSVSIAANTGTTICAGTSVTFTATPTNGGTTPAYQWKLNGTNVGSNSPTYTTTTLASGNVVTCELTSNVSCPTGNPATSNSLTFIVNTLPVPSFTDQPSSSECQGDNVTYTTLSGMTNYIWWVSGTSADYSITSGGIGTSSNTVTLKWLTTSNKTVTVGYTENGCTSATPASSTITVNPTPVIGTFN